MMLRSCLKLKTKITIPVLFAVAMLGTGCDRSDSAGNSAEGSEGAAVAGAPSFAASRPTSATGRSSRATPGTGRGNGGERGGSGVIERPTDPGTMPPQPGSGAGPGTGGGSHPMPIPGSKPDVDQPPGERPIGGTGPTPPSPICQTQAPQIKFLGCRGERQNPWYKRKTDTDLVPTLLSDLAEAENVERRRVEVAVIDSGFEYFSTRAYFETGDLVPTNFGDGSGSEGIPGVDFAMGVIGSPTRLQWRPQVQDRPSEVPGPGDKPEDFGYFDIPALHGTHVNGIIAGCNGYGVAENIILSSYKIKLADSSCEPDKNELEAGIDEVCFAPRRIHDVLPQGGSREGTFRVINISLGSMLDEIGYDKDGQPYDRFAAKMSAWSEAGCLVVQASGNSSHKRHYNVSQQFYRSGLLDEKEFAPEIGLLEPFYLPKIAVNPYRVDLNTTYQQRLVNSHLTIGATGILGYYADFSTWGELKAPGSKLPIFNSEMSGTSFSAPLVSGIAGETAATLKTFNFDHWQQLSPGEQVATVSHILASSQLGGSVNGLRAAYLAYHYAKHSLRGRQASFADAQSSASLATKCQQLSGALPETFDRNACSDGVDACYEQARTFFSLCPWTHERSYRQKMSLLVREAVRRGEFDQSGHWLEVYYRAIATSSRLTDDIKQEARNEIANLAVYNLEKGEGQRFAQELRIEEFNQRLGLLRLLSSASPDAMAAGVFDAALRGLLYSDLFRAKMSKRSNRGSEEMLAFLREALILRGRVQDDGVQNIMRKWLNQLNFSRSSLDDWRPYFRMLDVVAELGADFGYFDGILDIEKEFFVRMDAALLPEIEGPQGGLNRFGKFTYYKTPLAQLGGGLPYFSGDDSRQLDLTQFAGAARRYFIKHQMRSKNPLMALGFLTSITKTAPQGRIDPRRLGNYVEVYDHPVLVDGHLEHGEVLELKCNQSIGECASSLDSIFTYTEDGEFHIRVPCRFRRLGQSAQAMVEQAQLDIAGCGSLSAEDADLYHLTGGTGLPADHMDSGRMDTCYIGYQDEAVLTYLMDLMATAGNNYLYRKDVTALLANVVLAGRNDQLQMNYWQKIVAGGNDLDPDFVRGYLVAYLRGHYRSGFDVDPDNEAFASVDVLSQLVRHSPYVASYQMVDYTEIIHDVFVHAMSQGKSDLVTLYRRNQLLKGIVAFQSRLADGKVSTAMDMAEAMRITRVSEICRTFRNDTFRIAWGGIPLSYTELDEFFLPFERADSINPGIMINYRYLEEQAQMLMRTCM